MQKIGTEWLRDHMRNITATTEAANSATNALTFRLPSNSRRYRSEQIFAPAHKDNEFLERRDKYFAEWQSRAERLVEQATEYLKIAHDKVQSAELAKCAAEAELKRNHDQVEKQIDVIMREMEEQKERLASRLAAAEAQVAAAERQATAAEERANKAETSVRWLESALRAQALNKKLNLVLSAA